MEIERETGADLLALTLFPLVRAGFQSPHFSRRLGACFWPIAVRCDRQVSAKSGHRMPTKLVAIQYFGTAKVFLTISTDPANYLSRLAARHRAYGSRPIIR